MLYYLFEFLEEPIDFMGFDLVEVHVLGSKPPTLQIMIERKDRKNVTIKDCEKVSLCFFISQAMHTNGDLSIEATQ